MRQNIKGTKVKGTKVFREAKLLLRLMIPPFKREGSKGNRRFPLKLKIKVIY